MGYEGGGDIVGRDSLDRLCYDLMSRRHWNDGNGIDEPIAYNGLHSGL